MTSARIEPELPALRKLAEDLAARRKQPVSSAHLLAAVAVRPSAASELLAERRIGADVLVERAGTVPHDGDDAVKRALQRAREVAGRMDAPYATTLHVLIALASDPRSAARAVLDACAVDVGRLRAAAMNVGLGLVGQRRAAAPSRREATGRARAPAPSKAPPVEPRPRAPAVAVPLFPPQKPTPRGTAGASGSDAPRSTKMPVPVEPATVSGRRATAGAGSRFALDPQKFPTLHALGHNLTLAAERGELEPVVGRDAEIERILDVLAKRHSNSACLIGRAGVGKTSVVHGLAQRLARGGTPAADERIVVAVPVAELVAGTGVRGALAQRIGALCKEVAASAGRVIVFFDDIQELVGADSGDEGAAELKLALARGDMACIGATSVEGYRRAIENDAALARRFSALEIEEPSREDAFLILEAVAPRLSRHHDVGYAPEVLALSIGWTERYLSSGILPETPLSVLDLAGARARRRAMSDVSVEIVADVVSELAEVPVERLLESDRDRMLNLEALLGERVVGHAEPIRRIARILRRNAAGLGSRRPIGTFLLLGPTGVGKTETAKAVAEVLFHSDSAITRIDMAEYSEPHAVARLIGSPPGYVGHDAGGQLTEAVRRRAYQVILLDEIEKAHPEVLTTFLGVFDEGRLTDGRGRTVDFTNTVILMTSNIGAEEAGSAGKRRVGFGSEDGSSDELEARLVAAARKRLAPELYNRIDEVVVFAPLTRREAGEIAGRLLDAVARALHEHHGVRVEWGGDAVDVLLDSGGFEPSLGARPLKRAIARLIEAPLAEKILQGELARGDTVLVGAENGELSIDVVDAAAHAVHPAAE